MGIAPKLMEILDKNGFVSPTPIQQQAIPIAISGKDVMGIAQTGTGKTLAFGIPMLQKIAREKCQGLVLLPTRELAIQVNDSLQKIGRSLNLKTAVLIGGESMGRQLAALRRQPHILIATPGRLIDHLQQNAAGVIKNIGVLVLDEADRMLDMGFAPQLKQILKYLPEQRQTMLFSATMPAEIVQMASQYLKLPLRVEVAPPGTTASKVTQEIFFVAKPEKIRLLDKILQDYKGSVLVFSRTKFGAKKIAAQIRHMGHPAAEIHSNRSLNQRLEALEGFKIGRYRVLVATDIAARGIDVTGIELVVNFDLPENSADYVHRIGRTGRAGHTGHAISFATPDQGRDVKDIERLIKKPLAVSKLPVLPGMRPMPAGESQPARPERKFERGFSSQGGFSRGRGPRRDDKRGFGSRPGRSKPRPWQTDRPVFVQRHRPSEPGF